MRITIELEALVEPEVSFGPVNTESKMFDGRCFWVKVGGKNGEYLRMISIARKYSSEEADHEKKKN
jgi:hypothetical protein